MIFLLLLLHYVYTTTCTVYTVHVTPDDHYYPNTTCHHCHNLQHYLLNITKYFTSNTQLLFLPGLHHLHTHLIIQDVHNISLIGSTANGTVTLDTVIQCNSSVDILMNNITNLTLTDITIKNCKHDGYMNATVLITECTNVQWRRITVDSISSNGIIGINVLGNSCLSYIKSHKLSIDYNDTQSAQNNSYHTTLIVHYIIRDQSSEQGTLNFKFLQNFYNVKFELANTKIYGLRNIKSAIKVVFEAVTECQNIVNIRNCQITHNNIKNMNDLLLIRVSLPLTMSNNTVHIEDCCFSHNNGHEGSVIKFDGLIASALINHCKFYNNKDLDMISQSVIMIVQPNNHCKYKFFF